MKNHTERFINFEVRIKASLENVWNAWTTESGVKSFLAPDCKINFCPDGEYEIYFNPDAPYGKRGGEGLRIMSIQPMKMFSFSWNAPPSLPDVRDQRTHVVIRFLPGEAGFTIVSLFHDGWGAGGQWDDAFQYFENAWGKVVLPRLKYRFDHETPVDWSNPPDL